MANIVEKDWLTAAGLRAVVLLVSNGSHRCGYIGLPQGHALHGAEYNKPHAALAPADETEALGKRSYIALLVMAASDDEGRMRSPEIVFDVHGSLTYSSDGDQSYPVAGTEWWLGFDCAHSGDRTSYSSDGEFRSLEYVEAECESLAQQIVAKTITA